MLDIKSKLNQYKFELLIGIFVFIVMFVFFSRIHPIVIFDGDDWSLISDSRPALPKWHAWNPCRILPETFYPLCGYIAAYFVMPIVGDYFNALTFTISAVVSSFIALYIFLVILFAEKKFGLKTFSANLIGLLFLLFHFALFLQHSGLNNMYLFQTIDTACYFYYVIPNLLNASMILLLAQININDNYFQEVNFKNALLIFAIYMAIFSNILNSSMLAIFIIVELICKLNKRGLNRAYLKGFIKSNRVYCSIIVIWLISLIFEANGGRSKDLADSSNFIVNFIAIAPEFFKSIANENRGLAFVIFILLSLPFIWKKKSSDEAAAKILNWTGKFALCMPLWSIYTILVASKAGESFVLRKDVQFGLFFYFFMIVIAIFSYWLQKSSRFALIFPILVFALFTWSFSGKKNFTVSTINNVPEQVCLEISRDILNQYVTADKAGQTELILKVPKGDDIDNWPHPFYVGDNISRTLYSHGIIAHHLKVTVVADPEINKRYKINNR